MHTLLDEIIAFSTTNDLTENQFGLLALNDKNFVRDLKGDAGKRPRRVWPETEAKVRGFMATYRRQDAAA